jgi:hypothetical protein
MVVTIRSSIPGRMRLKVKELKRNPALADQIEGRLRAMEGVTEARASPATGSVLILYTKDRLRPQELSDVFPGVDSARWLSRLAPKPVTRGAIAASVAAFFERLNALVRRVTGVVDLRLLVPLVLIAWGIRELIVSERISRPAWYTLFWYAFGTYGRLLVRPSADDETE